MASNKRINKAYVRYDGSGRVIPGSLILNRFKPAVGNWHEIPAYECCNPSPVALPLRMLFSSILEADAIVGDSSNVSDWNTFFGLPLNGNPFTSVTVIGNEINLYGGSNIIIVEDKLENSNVLSIYDYAGSIVELQANGLGYNRNLISAYFPAVTIIGEYCFQYCTSLEDIYIPACIQLGQEVTDNGIFDSIVGNTISLTVNSTVMTCNAGNPDGDIQYLQANNTVTVITT